jgi:hypothetical protein
MFTKLLPSNGRHHGTALTLLFQFAGVMSHCSLLEAAHPQQPTGALPFLLF